jgi:membrane protein DedA with SNARE-associated domain
MDVVAIVGLTVLILVKEIGVPLPVPGDLILIGSGAYLATDPALAGAVLAIVLVASFIGASIQFFLFRSALRRPLLALLGRLGVGEARIHGQSDRLRSAGARAVALTRMTPGIRIAVVPAAALSAIPYSVFLPAIVAGNSVFIGVHFGAGFLLGAYARDFVSRLSDPLVLIPVLLVAFAVGGLIALRMRAQATKRKDTYECWADCSCPACVSIVAAAKSAS